MKSNDLLRRYSKHSKCATRSRSQVKAQTDRRLFLESLETRNLLATLWGIDRANLFSIDDYTQIGSGPAAAGLTKYATLKYQVDASGATANLQPQIKAFTLDQNGIGYFAYHGSLSFTDGQPTLTAPILLKIDTAAVTEAGPNVVSIIGSVPIGSLNVDAIRSLSVDPNTGDLFGTLKTSGADELIKISTTDGSITANIGKMQNAALGAVVDNAEDIEFDESGNLYVTDQTDDHIYQVDPATASIIAIVDNNVPGGIVPPAFGNIIVEGLGWDPDLNQLVGVEDEANLFYIQTLDDGNNIPLGSLLDLRSPSSIDFETPPTTPKIDIEKYVKSDGAGLGSDADTSADAIIVNVGDTITFSYVVTNPGTTPVNNVSVVDDGGLGPDFNPTRGPDIVGNNDNVLTPGEQWLYTATGTVSGSDCNIATVTGNNANPPNQPTSDTDPACWTPNPKIDIEKYVKSGGTGLGSDADTPAAAITVNVGDTITFSYVVTNPGVLPINNVVVNDDGGLGPDFNPTRGSDIVGNNDNVLTPGEQWLYTATGTASANDCNVAKVTGKNANPPNQSVNDTDPACWKVEVRPGIDIEKTTNGPSNANATSPDFDNEDAANGPGVPILTPGTTVTWTYKVTNTGNVPYAFNEVVVSDDNGTPGSTADDLSTTNGSITFQSVQTGDADNSLEPGEVWLYTATGTVQSLVVPSGGSPVTFNFSGSSALDGPDGNIRTFTAGSIAVKASAFSRTESGGTWSTAFLGSYPGGLGVTDSSETGSNDTHTVDNLGGRDNYVLFEFSESVIIDSAFLGYVVNDSDLTVWIGTKDDPFNNHLTLSDAVLSSLGFTETNLTDLTTTRTANLNSGNLAGNVVVIAAQVDDTTQEDKFKIEKVTVKPTKPGVYENKGVVKVPGDTDSDLSHYKNPAPTTPPPPPEPPVCVTIKTTGSTKTTGTKGNIRTFSFGNISVKASAFSRTNSTGAWLPAYLGAYSGGLGVTDSSESGSSNTHTVDNVGGRNNYVLFEFSQPVVVDKALLGYVAGDSDISVWIGTLDNPFENHQTLSDALLASLGFTEVNETTSTTTRTADINSGNRTGNVLVIAGSVADVTPDDQFKIGSLNVCIPGGTKFYVVNDSTTNKTYGYTAAGTLDAATNLVAANADPRGITTTANGSPVWVIDADKTVYVYDANGNALGSWGARKTAAENATVSTSVQGIATDGTDIWIVDDATNEVFYYADGAAWRDNGAPRNATSKFTLAAGNSNPRDITFGTIESGGVTKRYLWVVDDSTVDKVFRYELKADNSVQAVVSWTINSANSKPRGITLDPTGASQDIWIVDDGSKDKVYRYSNGKTRVTGTAPVAGVWTLASGNNSPQGIADPLQVFLDAEADANDPVIRFDVNGDGFVTPTDVLSIFNKLNSGSLPTSAEGEETNPLASYDVNGDGILTSFDALQVINYLNGLSDTAAAALGAATTEDTSSDSSLDDESDEDASEEVDSSQAIDIAFEQADDLQDDLVFVLSEDETDIIDQLMEEDGLLSE